MRKNSAENRKRKAPMSAEDSGGSNVIVQAGILAAASILSRVIGLLYRSPLTAIIGDEGNGYYGTAINIYTIILMVSCYGVPSAISKQMSQKIAVGEYKNAQRTFHCAMLYSVIVGAIGSLLLFFGAEVLVTPNSVPVLRVFAPTVFLFGILGVLRGYFQANQTMLQTSISQILEQITNAVVSIGAAYCLMRLVVSGDPTQRAIRGAQGSALGTGSGVLAALLFMIAVYWMHRRRFMDRVASDSSGKETAFGLLMKETIMVITPFILSSFILNLTTSVNMTIFEKMMIGVRGWEEVTTTTLYGLFSNKAVVITNIPISIATAVAAAILPNISTAFAQGDRRETRKRSVTAIRMTLIIAVPCAVGLLVLAKPVTMVLFPQWDTLDTASILLAELAVTVIFYSVGTITNAVLQSIGRINMPLVSAGIALAIQTGALVLLICFTDLGVHSLVLCSILYSVLIFLINNLFIAKYLRMHVRIGKVYGKPVLAAAVMGAVTWMVYTALDSLLVRLTGGQVYLSNLVTLLVAIVLAVILYFFVLIRIGGLKERDVLRLPKGMKIVALLRKLHWM